MLSPERESFLYLDPAGTVASVQGSRCAVVCILSIHVTTFIPMAVMTMISHCTGKQWRPRSVL